MHVFVLLLPAPKHIAQSPATLGPGIEGGGVGLAVKL